MIEGYIETFSIDNLSDQAEPQAGFEIKVCGYGDYWNLAKTWNTCRYGSPKDAAIICGKEKQNYEHIKKLFGKDFEEMEVDMMTLVKECVKKIDAENTSEELENLKKENTMLKNNIKKLIIEQEDAMEYIDELESKLSEYETNEAADIDDMTDCCCCGDDLPCCRDPRLAITPFIRSIHYCDKPGKEKTIVIFSDGSKVIKELVGGDKFDLNVGVALCIAERMYGSKTQYHKAVKTLAGITEKKK